MSDGYKPPPIGDQTRDTIQALSQYLPEYIDTLNQSRVPTAQSELAAAQAVSPGYYQMILDNYAKFGPQLNKQFADQAAANQRAAIGGDLAAIQGPGQELSAAAIDLMRKVDPEYFGTRELIAKRYGDYLSGLTDTLSPGERSEIERSLGRNEGTVSPGSNINTVEKAMTYGSAAGAKRNELANAINLGAQALPTLKSGADIFQIATGRAGLANQGNQVLGQGYVPGGQAGFTAGENLQNNIFSGMQNNVRVRGAGFRTIMDQVEQGTRAVGNLGSAAAAFGG